MWCPRQGSGGNSYPEHAQKWKAYGASILGGCSRTTAKEEIFSMSQNGNNFYSLQRLYYLTKTPYFASW